MRLTGKNGTICVKPILLTAVSELAERCFPEKEMNKLKGLFTKYRELILYVFFGGLTTAVNWIIYFPLVNWLHVHYQIANVIAWIAAVLFAFLTNKSLVFSSRDWSAKVVFTELPKFAGGRVFSLLVEMGLMFLLVDIARFNENIVKIIVAVIVVILNYIVSKLFVFKNDKDGKPKSKQK